MNTRRDFIAAAPAVAIAAAVPALALSAASLQAVTLPPGLSPPVAALQATYRDACKAYYSADPDIPDHLDERLYLDMVAAEDAFLACQVSNVADVHAKADALALLYRNTERFDQMHLDRLVQDLGSLLPPHSVGERSGELRS